MVSECSRFDATCVNTIGSFECVCPLGSQNKTIQIQNELKYGCVDIDECSENKHDCKNNSKCVNKIGGFLCECESGYSWDKELKKCFDIDECSLSADSAEIRTSCDEHSICINTIGSFVCQCELGWNKTDSIYCTGILYLRFEGSITI